MIYRIVGTVGYGMIIRKVIDMDMELKATIARLERDLKALKERSEVQLYSKLHCPICGRKKRVEHYKLISNSAGGYWLECEEDGRFRILPTRRKPDKRAGKRIIETVEASD